MHLASQGPNLTQASNHVDAVSSRPGQVQKQATSQPLGLGQRLGGKNIVRARAFSSLFAQPDPALVALWFDLAGGRASRRSTSCVGDAAAVALECIVHVTIRADMNISPRPHSIGCAAVPNLPSESLKIINRGSDGMRRDARHCRCQFICHLPLVSTKIKYYSRL